MVDGRAPAPARAVGVKPIGHRQAQPPGLTARTAATAVFRAVIERGQKLDEAFEAATAGLGHNDAALVRAIVTITLRHLGDIEQALARHLTKPLPAKAGLTRAIMATAAAQLFYMRVPAHATIDLAVRQAKADKKAQHQSGLVNAVLRKLERSGASAPAAGANIPEPFATRWRENWGDEAFAALVAELLHEPPLDLSVKSDTDQWAERLGARVLPTGSLRIDQPRGPIEALAGFDEGAWWVQDAAAALPVRLMGDVGGKQVLDLFAAPGGKTAQLIAAGAEMTAVDHAPQRMQRLRHNLARLHLDADTVVADALAFAPGVTFEAVLVDAPCTATGTARRNPDVLYHRSLADIADLACLSDTGPCPCGAAGASGRASHLLHLLARTGRGRSASAAVSRRKQRFSTRSSDGSRNRRASLPLSMPTVMYGPCRGRRWMAVAALTGFSSPACAECNRRYQNVNGLRDYNAGPVPRGTEFQTATMASSTPLSVHDEIVPITQAQLARLAMADMADGLGRRLSRLVPGLSTLRATGLGRPIPPLIRGRPERAGDIYRGTFSFAGHVERAAGSTVFAETAAPAGWLRQLHGFDWLKTWRRRDASSTGRTPAPSSRTGLPSPATIRPWRGATT